MPRSVAMNCNAVTQDVSGSSASELGKIFRPFWPGLKMQDTVRDMAPYGIFRLIANVDE